MYHQSKMNFSKRDSNKTWNLVSEVMGHKKRSSSISELLVNGETCIGNSEISIATYEYFDKVEANQGSHLLVCDNFLTSLDTDAESNFTFNIVAMKFLETIVRSLKISFQGHD